jgi:hypothetical protein
MTRGGRRPGAGRKPGVPSQKTLTRLKIAEEAAAEGITPLEVMLKTMRALWDVGSNEAKLAACKIAEDAAPYVHPRLAAIEQKTTLDAGDTLAALLNEIDGRTTGIATGVEDEGSPLAPEQSLSHH